MKRGDDPVTVVKESMKDTVPQTLYDSSTTRAHSARSIGGTSNSDDRKLVHEGEA